MVKIVEPLEPITYGEVKALTENKATVLIDDVEFMVVAFEDDLIPRDPKDQFSFMGKSLIGFLVDI